MKVELIMPIGGFGVRGGKITGLKHFTSTEVKEKKIKKKKVEEALVELLSYVESYVSENRFKIINTTENMFFFIVKE